MKSQTIYARVFVIGAPRSGTTLLQGMLAAHPQIKSFPETHFFSTAYPRNKLKRSITWPALNLRNAQKNLPSLIGRPDIQLKIGLLDWDFEKQFVEMLDQTTLDAGKNIWVEKTPGHINYIPEISERIPGAKFIHIIRNGDDVVASLYEVTHKDFSSWRKGKANPFSRGLSIDTCIERWNNAMRITKRWHRAPNHMAIDYEELVVNPRDEMMKVCSFLGIEYSSSMENGADSFSEIVTSDEKWKENNKKPPQIMPKKFQKIFTENQQKYILSRLIDRNIEGS